VTIGPSLLGESQTCYAGCNSECAQHCNTPARKASAAADAGDPALRAAGFEHSGSTELAEALSTVTLLSMVTTAKGRHRYLSRRRLGEGGREARSTIKTSAKAAARGRPRSPL
jgi:hypothetical protein